VTLVQGEILRVKITLLSAPGRNRRGKIEHRRKKQLVAGTKRERRWPARERKEEKIRVL